MLDFFMAFDDNSPVIICSYFYFQDINYLYVFLYFCSALSAR